MEKAKTKSKEEQISYHERKLAELRAPDKSGEFEEELNRHKETLETIFKALKKATNKKAWSR